MLERVGVDAARRGDRPSPGPARRRPRSQATGSATSGPRRRCPISATPRRRRACADDRFAAGTSSARRPAKLSQLTRPRTTSSASASSSSAGSRRTPSAISSKNDAPCAARCSATRRAREPSSASSARLGASRVHSGAARRGSSSTGVERSDAARGTALARERAQARPQRAPGRAQVVEPRAGVVLHARRQDLRFPHRRRRLEAFELAEHAGERVGAADAARRADALPVEQEAHEVARLDRLDLAAQALERVAMDAREQVPLAPLGVGTGRQQRREPALQHVAFGLQREQGELDLAARQPERRSERLGRRRTEAAEARAQQLAQRLVARREAFGAFGRRFDDGLQTRIGIEVAHAAPAARRRPTGRDRRRSGRRPRVGSRDPTPRALPATSTSRRSLRLAVGDDAERDQRLVHLVGVARARPGLVANARDRVGVELAERRRRSRGRRSGGSAPPASCAPRSARRRGTRRAARSAPRRRAATAPAGRARSPRPRPTRSGAAARASRPRPSRRRGSRASSARPADARAPRGRRRGSRRTRPGRGRRRRAGPPTSSAAAAARPSCRRVKRGNASAVVAFQRQRTAKSGASSSAWTSTSSAVAECR